MPSPEPREPSSTQARPRRADHSARVCLRYLQTVRIGDTSVGIGRTRPPYHPPK